MPPEGAICWVEHVSPDHRAAVAFYTRVLGLEAGDADSPFVFLRRGEADVMAAYSMPGPARWLPYVASKDAAASADRARTAGGTVHREATAVGDAGWSAWVADPEGTLVGIWQAGTHWGTTVGQVPGSLCRVDLHTRRPEGVERFLVDAFGLTPVPNDAGLRSLAAPGADPIHLVTMDDRWQGAPAAWVAQFSVPSVVNAVHSAEEAGGTVALAPRTAPGLGHFAILLDPHSLPFGVVQAT